LVERLVNIVYLLKLEPDKSRRMRLCLETADEDLRRLKELVHHPSADMKDDLAL